MYKGLVPWPRSKGPSPNRSKPIILTYRGWVPTDPKSPGRIIHIWTSRNGSVFPMFPKEFQEMLDTYPEIYDVITSGASAQLYADWEFCKRGTRYGIKLSRHMMGPKNVNGTTPMYNRMSHSASGVVMFDFIEHLGTTEGKSSLTRHRRMR